MLPERLQPFADKPTPVLDDGHVMLVDVMGDDMSIVHAARVSYGAGTKRVSEDRHLVRYLMRHRHSTPFEMCEIKLRVRVPMDTWRQWIRHRTASVNEYSTRYSEAIDSMSTAPEWRAQATKNKQGSSGVVTDWPEGFQRPKGFGFLGSPDTLKDIGGPENMDPGTYLSLREQFFQGEARAVYEERLQFGVAREVARKDLPLSTYTEAYWKVDLHNLFHFISLRLDPHAQLEIRLYAEAIAEIVKVWVPWAWEAFEDYRLKGMYLTRAEVVGLKTILSRLTSNGFQPDKLIEAGIKESGLTKGREADELRAKLQRLLGS